MDDLREVIVRAVELRIDDEPMIDSSSSYKRRIRAGWCADAALAAIKQAGFVVVPAEPAGESLIEAERIINLASNPEIWTSREILGLLIELLARGCGDAALAAIKQAGFVVVPAEPAEAILEAWQELDLPACGDIYGDAFISKSAAVDIYRAMIEASNAPT